MDLNRDQKAELLADGCHGSGPDAWFGLDDRVELFADDNDPDDPRVSLYVNGEDAGQTEPRLSDYPEPWRAGLLEERQRRQPR